MGVAQEKFIREFCEAWGDGSFEKKPDVEKILSMMSEDAEWQLWVPGGPIVRGRAGAGVYPQESRLLPIVWQQASSTTSSRSTSSRPARARLRT